MADCQEMIYSNEYMDFILNYTSPTGKRLFQEFGCKEIINAEFAIIHVNRKEETGSGRNLQYRNMPRVFGLLDTSHLEASGVSRVQRLPNLDLYGQGVIFGILDKGIDYRHPAFQNEDGSSRIGVIWDQTIPSDTPPEGLNYGTVYDNETINQALKSEDPLLVVPSMDEDGHGTFLAGIAAGSARKEQDFSGVAPLCELAVVKLKGAKEYLRNFWLIPEGVTAFQETDIFTGIRFILEYAYRQNKPFVLMLGCGTNAGNHGKTGYLKYYLNNISSFSGRGIVLPAGNEGSLSHHFRGNGLEMKEYQDVELHVAEGEKGFLAELWAEAPDTYSIGFLSPQGEYSQKLPLSIRDGGIEVGFVFEKTRIMVFYEPVERMTGDMLIWIRMSDPTPGIWRLRVFKENVLIGRYDIWLPMEHFIKKDTYFLKPDPDTTICEPGNGAYPMTVTAYDHQNGNLFFQASRGFTRDGGVKPDFAAPGVNVFGPALNGGYRTGTGTSVAAAVAAGCSVLLFNYSPYYTGLQLSNLFIKGTTRKNIIYPNKEWGFGEINLYRSLESLRGSVTE